MGLLTINVTQDLTKRFYVKDVKFAAKLLFDLEPYAIQRNSPNVLPPQNAGRNESAQEIATKIEERNRKVT